MFSHLTTRTRVAFWAVLILASGLLITLYVTSARKTDLNADLARSLIQFNVVLLFGAMVADFYKRSERQREEQPGHDHPGVA